MKKTEIERFEDIFKLELS